MALGAGRNTAIERCRASDAEKVTAGGGGDGGLVEGSGCAHGLPTSVLERALMVKLVIARRARRPVPRYPALAMGGESPRLSRATRAYPRAGGWSDEEPAHWQARPAHAKRPLPDPGSVACISGMV